jgi:hypothetical protein
MSALHPILLQNYFCDFRRATLIQGRAKVRNIGFEMLVLGFDNCALTAQQRVLQQNPSRSRLRAYSSGHRINRERLPANSILDPARMLQRRALVAALGAAGAASELVRGCVGSPPDDERRKRPSAGYRQQAEEDTCAEKSHS